MELFFSHRDYGKMSWLAWRLSPFSLRVMAVLAVIISCPVDAVCAGTESPSFHVSQAVSRYPELAVYLDAVDDSGNPLPLPPAGALSVLAGRHRLPVSSLARFSESGQGVAYIFLVDVSRSLGEEELAGMREAISSWVKSCHEKDRFALVTFGTEVLLRADFTADRDRFLHSVGDLHPTDMLTGLHSALVQAQRLGSRRDADLPLRRVVVVLSDGKDEALYGETAWEVSKQLQDASAPIFALGFYHPPYEEREAYLRQLALFAEESGGAYFSPVESGLEAVFCKLRARIDGTWVLNADVSDIVPSGQDLLVEAGLEHDGRFFSDTFSVRVIPPALSLWAGNPVISTSEDFPSIRQPVADAGSLASSGMEEGDSPVFPGSGAELTGGEPVNTEVSSSDPIQAEEGSVKGWRQWRFHFLGAAALVVLSLGFLARRAGTGPRNDVAVSSEAAPSRDRESDISDGVLLRLEAFRGPRVVRSFRIRLTGDRTLGRGPDNGISIPGDQAVSARHCELALLKEGAVAVRDLGSTNGTFVNNLRIDSLTVLKDGDMLRVGRTSLRVVYENGSVSSEGGF